MLISWLEDTIGKNQLDVYKARKKFSDNYFNIVAGYESIRNRKKVVIEN
ncbi:hypothetical protein JYT98_00580 [bacterium AH-315-K05]|nr:hypothetical protein [bacterium AH-315-L21]MBN4056551.1 hypothetical protein [bacterium AH-315-K05]MBN4074314.1 hypothetical protein [bacterium AH-315-E09]